MNFTLRPFNPRSCAHLTGMTGIGLALGILALLSGAPALADDAADADKAAQHSYGWMSDAADEAQEANAYVVSLKSAKGIIARYTSSISHAVSGSVLYDPSKESELEELRKFFLYNPFKESSFGLSLPKGDEQHREEITQLFLMIRRLSTDMFPDFFRMVNVVKLLELPKRVNALVKCYKYLDERWLDKFREFDKAFDEFIKLTEQMQQNDVNDVSGPELLMASRLDRFASAAMRPAASFDRELHALDNYLYSVRTEALDKLLADRASLLNFLYRADTAFKSTRDYFAKNYSFYAADVKPLMDNFERILIDVSDICDFINISVEEANSTSKMVGRLRTLKDLDPHRSLHLDDTTISNGCPAYARRVRLVLTICKERFMKAAEVVNRRHSGEARFKPAKW